jgi:hypothetical protein
VAKKRLLAPRISRLKKAETLGESPERSSLVVTYASRKAIDHLALIMLIGRGKPTYFFAAFFLAVFFATFFLAAFFATFFLAAFFLATLMSS